MFSVDRYEHLFTEVVNCSKVLHHVPEIQRRQMFDALYLPVYQYLIQERHKFVETNRNNDPRPFFVGVSAPQGCGKTTLTALLEEMMNSEGLPAISMSLDDFYLTGSDQENLARKHSENSLLQLRGNAGTHDLPLLQQTLQDLKEFSKISEGHSQSPPQIPRYEKSLRQGRGDRVAQEEWTTISQPVEIVFFEGWMLGFSPLLDIPHLQSIHPGLVEVNNYLRQYQDIHHLFDSWLILAVQSPEIVYRWRLQAEHATRAKGKPSLTDEQVKDFVDRFMPAYHAYLPAFYSIGPEGRWGVSSLKILVDDNRQPIGFEELDSNSAAKSKL
jgi:D-glycerate 3-kinase